MLAPPPAHAVYDDEEVGGYAVIIQPRKFKLAHEFSGSAGVQPMNAYYKGVLFTGRYTLHFDDFQAWEILGFTYAWNVDTGLEQEILRWGAEPESSEFDQLQFMFESNYILKPAYAKLALFNRAILYSELFFNVGGAAAKYVSSWRPGAEYGVGLRFFIAEAFSIRLNFRHYLFLNGIPFLTPNAGLENVLCMTAGGSVNVGY